MQLRPDRLVAVLAVLALTLTACGRGDGEDPEVALTAVPAADAASPTPTVSATEATPTPTASPTTTPEPAPSPTPTEPDIVPPASTTTALTASGAYLQPSPGGLALANDDNVACPLVPHEELIVVECVVAEGPGGVFAVAIVEYAETRQARLYAYVDGADEWRPVAAGPEYGPDAPDYVSFTPTVTWWTFAWNVVLLEGLVGGSGAVSGFDVVTWEAGEPDPTVLGHLPERPGTYLQPVAGTLVVSNPNHSDGAPNCCPTMHDLRVVDLGAGTVRLWAEIPVDEVVPEVAALRYYVHRIQGEATAAEYATASVAAMTWPTPGPDTHLAIVPCVPDGDVMRCTLQNEAGVNHLLVAPGGAWGWRVVEVESFAD